MRSAEFWRSTPADLYYMAQGMKRRDRTTWQRFAMIVTNPHFEKPMSVQKLLGTLGLGDPVKEPKALTEEEAKELVEEIAREHKKKFWTMFDNKYAPQGDKE